MKNVKLFEDYYPEDFYDKYLPKDGSYEYKEDYHPKYILKDVPIELLDAIIEGEIDLKGLALEELESRSMAKLENKK